MNTIWEEENYTEQETNCLSSSDNAPSGSTNVTESVLTTNEWNVTGSLNQAYKLCYDGVTNTHLEKNYMYGIYLWSELHQGVEYPCYVGQTINKIHHRINGHMVYDREFLFQRKLRKRPQNFKCYWVDAARNFEELDGLETFYIKKFNTFHDDNPRGYNLERGGTRNHIVSEETRKKISEKLKAYHPMKGKHHSEETKEKIRNSRKWYKTPQSTIDRMLEGAKKAIRTPEWKLKLSVSNTGKKRNNTAKERMRVAKLGTKQTEEHIKNRTMNMRGRKLPDQLKKQISKKLMGHTNNSSTGVCGVSKHLGKYLANGPMTNGKRKYIGIYKTVDEAKLAIEKFNNNEHRT